MPASEGDCGGFVSDCPLASVFCVSFIYEGDCGGVTLTAPLHCW